MKLVAFVCIDLEEDDGRFAIVQAANLQSIVAYCNRDINKNVFECFYCTLKGMGLATPQEENVILHLKFACTDLRSCEFNCRSLFA